ncbi:MAG: efflux RND transporter periplasmic adaptor subunit [Ignavibacteriaceae bacterium]
MKKQLIIKISSVVVIIAAGFLGMTALSSSSKHSNERVSKPEVRTVNTKAVKFGDHTLQIEGNGVIESQRMLNIVSEANGIVLYAKNNLKDGTFVREGEMILDIDSREVENDLYSLRSSFMNAVASILPDMKIEDKQVYQKWFNYFSSIEIKKDLTELPHITNQQEKMKLSSRDIFTKYYSVKNQEILLSKYKIKAPFDGFITSNGIIENSYISKGQNLFSISDAKNLDIAVPLLVDEINMIDFSKTPSVKIYSDKSSNDFMYGKILRKETNLDRNSQTLNVYVSFNNSSMNPYFLPGNYVNLKIEGKRLKNVAAIPRNLVDNDGFVYTIKSGKLAKEEVDLITVQGNKAIIKNTIPENTVLVTTILQKPLVGMEIKSSDKTANTQEKKSDISADQLSKLD